VWPQARDQPSQLVGRCCDGFGGAETRLHPPEEGPSGTLRVGQTAGRKAEGDGDARRAGAPPPRPHLTTRELVLGTQPQPAPAVLHTRPAVHVRADLTADDPGGAFCDALHGRQVDASEAIAWGTGIAPGLIGLLVSVSLGGGRAGPHVYRHRSADAL
jgi:hypothetical protein